MSHVAMAFITLEAKVYIDVIFDESHSHRFRARSSARPAARRARARASATAGADGRIRFPEDSIPRRDHGRDPTRCDVISSGSSSISCSHAHKVQC